MGYFLKSINILNIILMIGVVMSTQYILFPIINTDIKYTPPKVNKTVPEEDEETVRSHAQSPLDYTMVAEQNLFHPERKIPVEKAENKPLPKPEIILYGTLITDDISLAYIEDKKSPITTPGRGKRMKALKKGDVISGFVLKEIGHDKIVMVRGDEIMTVLLDEARSKTRDSSGMPTGTIPPPIDPKAIPKPPPLP